MSLYYSMLRRLASSSIAPLAIRAVGSPRSLRGAISTVQGLHGTRLSFLSSHSCFSTAVAKKELSSDDGLLRIIDSEIAHAENEDHDSIPSEFPFEVQDKPGERIILLSRKYQNEDIKILVDMPNPEPDQYEDDANADADADTNGDDDKDYVVEASIPLVVSVSKGNGLCLEFGITASPHDISIDSLSIKNPEFEDQIAYEGPDFGDLDEKLQGAFYKFLEVRGIKPSTMNVILEYMINKDQTEYKMWLENLKSFVNK